MKQHWASGQSPLSMSQRKHDTESCIEGHEGREGAVLLEHLAGGHVPWQASRQDAQRRQHAAD